MILHRFEAGCYEGEQVLQHECISVRGHRDVVQSIKARQQQRLGFVVPAEGVDVLFEAHLPTFERETFRKVSCSELLPDEVVALLDAHYGLHGMDQHALHELEVRSLLN